jgi:hypothetical protein
VYPSVVFDKVDVYRVGELATKRRANDPGPYGNKTSAILARLVKGEERDEQSLIEEPGIGVTCVNYTINFPV